MEIIIETLDGSALTDTGSRFQFPSLPSELKVKNGANHQSYKIIGLGEIKIPKGTEVEEISWDGTFFGPSKMNELMIQFYTAPKLCVEILERLRNNGTPLRLMCSEVGVDRDVTISDFQWEPYGGHGNFRYRISFVRWRSLTVKVLTHSANTNAATGARTDKGNQKAYTVVKGDCLWNIAKKHLGDGARWLEILKINRETIDAAARKYGHKDSNNGYWIFPGTVLTIPTK